MIADFWYWWLPLMAASAPASMSAGEVGAIIGGLIAFLIGGGFLGKKITESQRVSIDSQPLQVKMEENFISRREHDSFRAEVRMDFRKLELAIERGAQRVDEKHLQLLATLERVAKTGVDGRVHIWNELKEQGKQVSAIEERTNTGKEIARLIETIKKEQNNV